MGEFAVVFLAGFFIAVGVVWKRVLVFGRGRFRNDAIKEMKRGLEDIEWKEIK